VRDPYEADIEARRAEHERWLRGPAGYVAAVERIELPIGATREVHGLVIEALPDGFRVDGERTGPRTVETGGRYRLRLSHQNFPAIVILDAESPRLREPVVPRWFPVDRAYRFVLPLEPDGARADIRTTRDQDRPAERAGWFTVPLDGRGYRLSATRFLEPGGGEIEVYFSDATSGRESYRMRYVPAEREGDRWLLDFNRTYNPACAWSPFYNCPLPPAENRLHVALRVGEMSPGTSSAAEATGGRPWRQEAKS